MRALKYGDYDSEVECVRHVECFDRDGPTPCSSVLAFQPCHAIFVHTASCYGVWL